jgi:drug/metabolite transporter (DMT)-like permease
MPSDRAAPPTLVLVLGALICFAANSVLCRAALAGGETGPGVFTAMRLVSGAVALFAIAAATGRPKRGRAGLSAAAGFWLFLYAAAFSFAYVGLDAGIGALILFGAVQVTMFAGGLIGGERPSLARWLGGACAFGGLAFLAAPGADAPPLVAAALMAVSGVAWGVFSLRGRRATDPLANIATAFVTAAPLGAALWLAVGLSEPVTAEGAALAVASGVLASGGGYAVWYAALPRMDASLAAVAQLAVPLIALGGGILFLGEAATARFAVSAALILGGVGVATLLGRDQRRAR